MSSRRVPIGVMFSVDGPYGVVARTMLNGALLAIEEHNALGGWQIEPTIVNPSGELPRYFEQCARLLASGIRHVVGCYTSSSRKEVIPLFEKHDALLWYPSHYEGFECSSNVVYTGAVANQHLLPLVRFLLENCGRSAYCIGSNYIWAWENNRILREQLCQLGGDVVGERYFPVGDTDFAQVIDAILEIRPAFLFNALIGVSAYQFLRDFRQACAARGIDQVAEIPIASCSLSEPELEMIGPDAVDGHLSASVYFSSLRSAENTRFVAAYTSRFPEGPAVCADAEATYLAVCLLARALEAAADDSVAAVKRSVVQQRIAAPQGEVWIDHETLHAALTPRIGRSTKSARFEILVDAPAPILPDPYLIWHSPRIGARPVLRAAS